MKIFIAGATGVLGRRVMPKLIAAGHQVVGLSRSPQNDEWLAARQAIARRGNLLNAQQMRQLTGDCDAILHLATAIPTKARTTLKDWQLNDRVRREGTHNLVAAALHHQCRLYVQESVVFLYGDQQGEWVDEATPLPTHQAPNIQSAFDMERIVQDASAAADLPGVILRFGSFYGPDASHTQTMFAMTQKRALPIIGPGNAYVNPIHLDDAAEAIVKTVGAHQTMQQRVFNVVDDEPVTYRDLIGAIAAQLGARKPLHLPVWLGRVLLGSQRVDSLLASVRCRNQRFKAATGWQPRYPTYREGIAATVGQWRALDPVHTLIPQAEKA